ncbi:MAG: lipopolysaccharide biosynthesis protein [Prevotella sp.]|nr:lipopolysaccharide biosynthesis protein [Candidatus Prevotella equi]
MSDNYSNNKRIAKNTLLLYARMLLMMIISLYTSRVILNALGVEDYGIYNVVGGVVSMFSILSGSLSAAISRFITYELGKGDRERLRNVFCTAINVQIFLIIIISILLETVGLWFLNNKMVIPTDRLLAANWVFQFSVITFAIHLWSVPYNASIIAHERMSAFAYISIFDAIARLAISFVILKNPFDRLIYYAVLIFFVGLIQRFLYTSYCKRHFIECHFRLMYDKSITKEIFSFAGWNFIGSSSAILRDQGGNMILNLFFGPTVNAARGVAMSVNHTVTGFVTNFMTAINPQITKSYASGDRNYMFKLVFQGARLSYYILFILALPILFTTQYLLEIWLGIVPEHSVHFARLVLIFTLSESLANPLVTVMLATGNIRNYQLIVGGCQLLNLPVSYMFLCIGYPPESVFMVAIGISALCEMMRLIMLRKMIKLSVRSFLRNVYFNVIEVSIIASIMPFVLIQYMGINTLMDFINMALLSILSAILTIYFIGCNNQDRAIVHNALRKIILKLK